MKKTSMMKFALMGILALGLMGGDAFAKSYGGGSRSSGGFSRSSSPSKSYSKSTPTKSYTKSKPTTGNSSKYKPSTSTSKPKATAPKTSGGFGKKKVDTKSPAYAKTNAKIKKDFGTSNKKYSSMKEAKADLGGKMASKKYTYRDSASAMASRPSHIPQSYGGYNTTYNINTGGYGYYGAGNVWVPYLATHMIISDAMMHSYAPNAYNQHVVVHRSGGGVMIGVLIGFGVIAVVCMGVAVTRG
jgi:hypothetical protein